MQPKPSQTPSWVPAGLSSQIKEGGDYLCVTIQAEPVVVIRNHEGELRALSRVCRHRGFDMLEGTGRASTKLCGAVGRVKNISCPYHAWTYNLDGELIGAPVSDGIPGFDKGDVSLPSFAVAEHQGLIFVCLDEPAPVLADQLEELRVDVNALVVEFNNESAEGELS